MRSTNFLSKVSILFFMIVATGCKFHSNNDSGLQDEGFEKKIPEKEVSGDDESGEKVLSKKGTGEQSDEEMDAEPLGKKLPAQENAPTTTIKITGKAADQLLDALLTLKLPDDGRLGATNVAVDSILCSKVVSPFAQPKCIASADKRDYPFYGHAIDEVFAVLETNEAYRDTGDRLGVSELYASQVICSRPVVPQPVTHCEMSVEIAKK